MPAEAQSPRLADSCGAFFAVAVAAVDSASVGVSPLVYGARSCAKAPNWFRSPKGAAQPPPTHLSISFSCLLLFSMFVSSIMYVQTRDGQSEVAGSQPSASCCLTCCTLLPWWITCWQALGFFFVFLFLLPFCSATDCLRRHRRRRLGNWSCYVNCCGWNELAAVHKTQECSKCLSASWVLTRLHFGLFFLGGGGASRKYFLWYCLRNSKD